MEQVALKEEDQVSQIRNINSSMVINLKKMKLKFNETQEKIGIVDKLADYDFIDELLTSPFWKLYMARKRLFRKSPSALKQETHDSPLLSVKIYHKSKLIADKGLLNYVISECSYFQECTTPYIPILRRVFITEGELVMVSDFYDGLLLSELFSGSKAKANR